MYATFQTAENQDAHVDGLPGRLPKRRKQVARACTWCRTYRVKCDAQYPCRNCKLKNRMCTADQGERHIRTFPSAVKEIDRLQDRIKQLEEQLSNLNTSHDSKEATAFNLNAATIKQNSAALPEEFDPLAQHGSNRRYYNWSLTLREIKPGTNQTYGPSSMFCYIERLSSYIDHVIVILPEDPDVTNNHAHKSTLVSLQRALAGRDSSSTDSRFEERYLSRSEEQGLLDLYWLHIHAQHPVVDRKFFQEHYDRLWDSRLSRASSSLVDIIIALCQQLKAVIDGVNVIQAGKWYYRRSQSLIQDELDEPSVHTFQSYYLSALWLSRASLHNQAHGALATGLRVGVILGLHVEPHSDLPVTVRDFFKRLWWLMYSMEAQYAMDFGRPLAVHFSQVTCTLPSSMPSVKVDPDAMHLDTNFADQRIRLILATRSIYILFYRECAKALQESEQTDLYEGNLKGLERCAIWLDSREKYLNAWEGQVPDNLRLRRNAGGTFSSIDLSQLVLGSPDGSKSVASSVLLALLYHSAAMSLYRPFLTFNEGGNTQSPAIRRHATSCAEHAIAIIDIISQDLNGQRGSLPLLETWSLILHAALALIGYLVAYPEGRLVQTSKDIIHTAINCANTLGEAFPGAIMTKNVLGDLLRKVDSSAIHVPRSTLRESDIGAANQHTNARTPLLDPGELEKHGFYSSQHDWTSEEFSFDGFVGQRNVLTSEEWLSNLLNLETTFST